MNQLSGSDTLFLSMETQRTPQHVGGLSIYDPCTAPGGSVRFKDILRSTEERLHLAKQFRQRLVHSPLHLDYPYWFDDPDFDIEYHVRHIALPRPGDWRQLCIQVARLQSQPLDLTKPLWEFDVIEGLDNVKGIPKGCYAILSKIHHAAIDGQGGMNMSAATHSLSPTKQTVPAQEKWTAEPIPGYAKLLLKASKNTVLTPVKIAGLVKETIPSLLSTALSILRKDISIASNKVPRTRFDGVVSSQRVFEAKSFDLDTIREMKNQAEKTTVNDVVLSIVSGAMKRYLEDKNELPDESLVAFVPVSVRSEDEEHVTGNRVTAMTIPLATNIPDPVDRLKAIRESSLAKKALTNAIGARKLAEFSNIMSPTMQGLAMRLYTGFGLANKINFLANLSITNVPGPQQPLYSVGAKLVTQYGLGPIFDGAGIMHIAGSYCGQLNISVISCRSMMPDPGFYAECLQQSFDELKAGLLKRPPAKREKRPQRKRV